VGHPRFIFTLARPVGPPPPASRAGSGPGTAEHVGALVRWRLLSANNRQLGRSAELFHGVAEAREAAAAIRDGADSLEQYVVRLTSPVRWGWSLVLDGMVVAVSGRGYEGERTALHALDLFLSAATQAPLDPSHDVIPPQRGVDMLDRSSFDLPGSSAW
jgi:uncharacterized protein YegP (UPF0339 family)